jgi:hypothetical protein
MWQYPPLAALIFLLGYLIAPQTFGFVFLATAVDVLLFYYLLEAGKDKEIRTYLPAAVWVSSAVFMGPIMLGRFDVFPTFFAVVALLFASNSKIFGINAAIGAILKVWPALLLIGQPKRILKTSVIWFTSIFVSFSFLLTLWWPNSFSFITGQKSRGLQIESVAALPYMIWHSGVEHLQIQFRYGAIEVLANGIGAVSLVISIIGALLIAQVIRWRLKGLIEEVLSPQYLIWLFGLLAVCALNPPKNFVSIFSFVAVSAFLGQVIFPGLYMGYMMGGVIPLFIQIVRIAALLIATYLMWRNLKLQLVKTT